MATAAGDFGELALAVFRHQYQSCAPYERYCRQLGRTPETVSYWRDVPAVPTDVFRELDLATFPTSEATSAFHTSGTRDGRPGTHLFRDLELYDLAISLSFPKALGLGSTRVRARILAPSFEDAPHSSLSYMLQWIGAQHADEGSAFYFADGELDFEGFVRDLRQDINEKRSVLLLGTAFAFLNLFDRYPDELFIVPPESKLMETGGFKGRSREVTRDELYEKFSMHFGLSRDRCVSEYGMTELFSQCYSTPDSNFFIPPHWLRVRVVEPLSGADVAIGEEGVIEFFDLANLETISAIRTSDRGRRGQIGFELLGRAPLARLRGCSTAFDL